MVIILNDYLSFYRELVKIGVLLDRLFLLSSEVIQELRCDVK